MNQDKIVAFLQAAVECSVYLAPTEGGLTYEEIYHAGTQAGLQLGEIGDALPSVTNQPLKEKRLQPHSNSVKPWNFYHLYEEPDFRNFAAFDLVFAELRISAESHAVEGLERKFIIERAAISELPETDIEAALTILIMSGQITENEGRLRAAPNILARPLPGETHARAVAANRNCPKRNDLRALAYPIVKELLLQRISHRIPSNDPLDLFADELGKPGHAALQLWWKQTVAEFRHCDPRLSPVAQSVLGLALVEGALAVCVKHARELALPAFAAAKFDLDPKKWQVEDLLACAAAGNDSALLDPAAKYHAEGLLLTRQRLHAGWMLSEYPEGFSDHDFSDGSDPKATVDQVVGRAVAWLRKNPPGTSAPPIWRGELGANHVFAPEPSWLPSQSNLRAGKMA